MKFSFPSFTNIENLIERGDGLHYIKYSKYPFSGFAFSTVCFDEKNKNQKEQIKHNELHCYKEGLLIAWTGFYSYEESWIPECPLVHGLYYYGPDSVQNCERILIQEQNETLDVYFLDGLFGWSLKDDFSGIKIFLRFPTLNEVELDNFHKWDVDPIEKEANVFIKDGKNTKYVNDYLKSQLYQLYKYAWEDCKKDFDEIYDFFSMSTGIFWAKSDSTKYEHMGKYLEPKCICSGHYSFDDKLFLTKEFKFDNKSKRFIKDYIKYFGIENIGVRGQTESWASLIETWSWERFVIGSRGYFNSLNLKDLDNLSKVSPLG